MRTFVALPVAAAEARRSLEQVRDRLRSTRADVKWVEPENYHVTARFLGDIDEAILDQVKAAVRAAAEVIEPLEAQLLGVGAFPDARKPQVIWAGLREEDRTPLSVLVKALSDGLAEAGIAPEKKPFHAHVTLGRARRGGAGGTLRDEIHKMSALYIARFPINTITLYESRLTPTGAVYSPLLETPLGREGQP
jgi:RNA 2',3'-cyclic 3'-phosphodiesterase